VLFYSAIKLKLVIYKLFRTVIRSKH